MRLTALCLAGLLALTPAVQAFAAQEDTEEAGEDILTGETEPAGELDLDGTPEEEDYYDDQGLLLEALEEEEAAAGETAGEVTEEAPEASEEASEALPEEEEAREEVPEETPSGEILLEDEVLEEAADEAVLPRQNASSDELFELYFAREMDQSLGIAASLSPARMQSVSLRGRQALNETLRGLYDQIAPAIRDIAAGNVTDTRIPCSFSVTYTVEDLSAYTDTDLSQVDAAAASEASALVKQLAGYNTGSLKLLTSALKADMPYDLYWAATTLSFSLGTARTTRKTQTVDGERKAVSYTFEITGPFSLQVSKDYRPEGDPGTEETDASGQAVIRYYRTDPEKTGAAAATTAAAREIAEKYASLPDLDKLRAYAEEIVNLVSYNTEVSGWSGDQAATDYGDPWQLIYVFDGDPATNVVCEGYAKAFKYLCDLSSFEDSALQAATVMGSLKGVNHMWNQVETSKGNFLVDLTNDDLDAGAGADLGGRLFLVGDRDVTPDTAWKGSPDAGYTVTTPDKALAYSYDDDCRSIYSEAFLTIGPFDLVHEDTDEDGLCDACGHVRVTGGDKSACAFPFEGTPDAGGDGQVSIRDLEGRILYLGLAGTDAALFDNEKYPHTLFCQDLDGEKVTYLFAGWYEEADGNMVPMTSLPDGTETAYAAFADAGILSVRLQLIYGADLTSEKTSIRFLSTVDSLHYQAAGFAFTIDRDGEVTEKDASSATVYASLQGRTDEGKKTYAPDLFSPASAYFFAFVLRDIPEEDYNTSVTVVPYWVTEDGTRVEGVSRTLTPAEFLARND